MMVTANEHATESKSFAPKDPPKLNPPKDDPISLEDLAKCNGRITRSCESIDELQSLANLVAIHLLKAPTLHTLRT